LADVKDSEKRLQVFLLGLKPLIAVTDLPAGL